jgi:hypothetical protein
MIGTSHKGTKSKNCTKKAFVNLSDFVTSWQVRSQRTKIPVVTIVVA